MSAREIIAAGVKHIEFDIAGRGIQQFNAARKSAGILRIQRKLARRTCQCALRNKLRTRGIPMPGVTPLQLTGASLEVLNNRPRHWNSRSLDIPLSLIHI